MKTNQKESDPLDLNSNTQQVQILELGLDPNRIQHFGKGPDPLGGPKHPAGANGKSEILVKGPDIYVNHGFGSRGPDQTTTDMDPRICSADPTTKCGPFRCPSWT